MLYISIISNYFLPWPQGHGAIDEVIAEEDAVLSSTISRCHED
jgi:hypothetical protein